jgi:hypothetical protein
LLPPIAVGDLSRLRALFWSLGLSPADDGFVAPHLCINYDAHESVIIGDTYEVPKMLPNILTNKDYVKSTIWVAIVNHETDCKKRTT